MGTGTSTFTRNPYPRITNALANVFITVPAASDLLTIGRAIRNDLEAPSLATIHVSGAGRLRLREGGTTATDIFSGSWEQSGGILQVGETFGDGINALGFKNGDPRQANTITVHNNATLAVGVVGSGAATPPWLRANVILSPGKIASTNGIDAQFGGDFIIGEGGGFASRVLLFDPVSPSTVRNVSLVAGAAGADNNAAVTTWDIGVVVDPGTTIGGAFNIARTGGTVSVSPGATLHIFPGATVNLGGTLDALSDGVDHVHVFNNSTTSFNVTAGNKNVGQLFGTGNTTVSGGATLIADFVRQNALTIADSSRVNIRAGFGNFGTSRVTTLNLNATARLDLNDHALIVVGGNVGTASPGSGIYSGLSGLIQSAYDSSTWAGPGITTSLPAAQTGLTTIGIATGTQIRGLAPSETDLFGGQTINGASVIAMYTYAGDGNLDGVIDGGDYGLIDNNVQIAGASGYFNGDFNYDGVIDGGDYGIIDNNIQAQGAPFPTSESAAGLAGATEVPEPMAVTLLLLPLAILIRRRGKRRMNAGSVD
jgi:hypothetical protein